MKLDACPLTAKEDEGEGCRVLIPLGFCSIPDQNLGPHVDGYRETGNRISLRKEHLVLSCSKLTEGSQHPESVRGVCCTWFRATWIKFPSKYTSIWKLRESAWDKACLVSCQTELLERQSGRHRMWLFRSCPVIVWSHAGHSTLVVSVHLLFLCGLPNSNIGCRLVFRNELSSASKSPYT